jgi:RNA polymerase sigma-70 factor (ECF subfamily)
MLRYSVHLEHSMRADREPATDLPSAEHGSDAAPSLSTVRGYTLRISRARARGVEIANVMSPDDAIPRHADIDALHREYATAVYAWACLRIGQRLRAWITPEDLAQEVWMRAMKAAPTRDPSAAPRAWLFTIGKHVLYEVHRALQRDRSEGAGGSTSRLVALDGVPADVTSLTQRLARDDAVRDFLSRAEALDADDRMLLIHVGLEGMPQPEAAARLGLSIDAARKRWQRLRERLRNWPCAQHLVP